MNPYEVLGVSEQDTDEEIKAAYRRLVKKYHPDRYPHGSPEQAQAAEKLKQVNAAYDMVTKIRAGTYNWSGAPQFGEIRAAIQRGQLGVAESMLNQMTERPAEWHFLMGIVLARRGWSDGAAQQFRTAYQMEPGNKEYENAWRAMTQAAGMYADFGDEEVQMNGSNRACTICSSCLCLSCLAGSCCGGWGVPVFCCC